MSLLLPVVFDLSVVPPSRTAWPEQPGVRR